MGGGRGKLCPDFDITPLQALVLSRPDLSPAGAARSPQAHLMSLRFAFSCFTNVAFFTDRGSSLCQQRDDDSVHWDTPCISVHADGATKAPQLDPSRPVQLEEAMLRREAGARCCGTGMNLSESIAWREYDVRWICKTSQSFLQLKENHVSNLAPAQMCRLHTPHCHPQGFPDLTSNSPALHSALPVFSHHHFNGSNSDRSTILSITHDNSR